MQIKPISLYRSSKVLLTVLEISPNILFLKNHYYDSIRGSKCSSFSGTFFLSFLGSLNSKNSFFKMRYASSIRHSVDLDSVVLFRCLSRTSFKKCKRPHWEYQDAIGLHLVLRKSKYHVQGDFKISSGFYTKNIFAFLDLRLNLLQQKLSHTSSRKVILQVEV